MHDRIKNILLTIIVLIATVAASEIVLDHFAIVKKIPSGWGWADSPLRGRQPATASREVNEFGLRGQPFSYAKDDFVVLLLGDSQVEAAASPTVFMPEALLQEELKARLNRPVKVFSLASSGWGQDQQLISLRNYLASRRADLVLVWATPLNDFWENAFPDRNTSKTAGGIKPTFKLEGETLFGPFFPKPFYFSHFAVSDLVLRAYYHAFRGETINQAIVDAWQSSLPIANKRKSSQCDAYEKIDAEAFATKNFLFDLSKPYTVVTNEDVEHSRSHHAPLTLPETELDRYQKRITKALFSQLKTLATQHGASFKVFFPLTRLDLSHKSIKCVLTSNGAYFEYNGALEELMKETVDISDLILFDVEGGVENVVKSDDRHLSDIGNRKAMRSLARLLKVEPKAP